MYSICRHLVSIWFLTLVAMVATSTSALAETDIEVSSIRIGAHNDYTRFVLDMNHQATPRIFTLADPYRVVIDLPEVEWTGDGVPAVSSKSLISGYRYGLFKPGNSRVVLDLKEPAKINQILNLSPDGTRGHRIVIDLRTIDREAFLATAGWPKEMIASAKPVQTPKPRPNNKRKTIVIDAGHGGMDPGTIGASGTHEKKVALAAAKALKKELLASGKYNVVLTREDDVFYSLPERVSIARAAHADLFISLHADSIGKKNVRGLSVYTLSEKASDREAAMLARKENRADVIAGVDMSHESADVSMILIELSQRETKNRSVQFTQFLVPQLAKNNKMLKNTHRFAGFHVLKAPDIPSVLIELGYLSNRADEKNLRSSKWRTQVAKSIARSVDNYFIAIENGLSPTQHASLFRAQD